MSPIQAGRLRHVISIVELTRAQDTFGGISNAIATVATSRASIEALTGRELYNAQQMVAEVTHKIVIRWLSGIKAKQNILFGSRTFQIMAVVNPDEVHRLLELLCIERDDSARDGVGSNGTLTVTHPISGGLTRATFAADGTTNIFNLPSSPIGELTWYRNGALQDSPDDYTILGTTITVQLAAHELAGDKFQAVYAS